MSRGKSNFGDGFSNWLESIILGTDQFLSPSMGGGIKGAKSPELAEGSGSCHPELAKDLVFNY